MVGDTLLDTLNHQYITHITLPPAALSTLPVSARLNNLPTIIVAGEAISQTLAEQWSQKYRLINDQC